MNSESHTCLNCGGKISGNYCAACGQETDLGRLSFKSVWKAVIDTAFSFDTPLLHTMGKLLTNPGQVFREYAAGRRKTYYSPIAFFVFCTVTYIVVRVLTNYDPFERRFDNPEELGRLEEAGRFMAGNIRNIMIFLALSIGLNFKLLFRKEFNLAEYSMMGFYIAGLYILMAIPFILISLTGLQIHPVFQMAILIAVILYACYSLFRSTRFVSLIKYVLVAFLSVLFYIVLGFGFSYLVVSIL